MNTVDTNDLDPLDLKPLRLDLAVGLMSLWESRWWEGHRTSLVTADDNRVHGDITEPADAVRAMTQWIGENFTPDIVEFFAVHLAGIRMLLEEVAVGEYRRVDDRLAELEARMAEFDAVRQALAMIGAAFNAGLSSPVDT